MPTEYIALGLALLAVAAFIVVLFVIEIRAAVRGEATISEGAQRLAAGMGIQLVAGISFVLGVVAGWFIAHFTSAPPV
jgi:hypothetical protein